MGSVDKSAASFVPIEIQVKDSRSSDSNVLSFPVNDAALVDFLEHLQRLQALK